MSIWWLVTKWKNYECIHKKNYYGGQTLISKRILLLIIELYYWDILISLISSRYLYMWPYYLLPTVWTLLKNVCYSLSAPESFLMDKKMLESMIYSPQIEEKKNHGIDYLE